MTTEELLLEFACWNDDIRNVLKHETLMDRVRAFLAELAERERTQCPTCGGTGAGAFNRERLIFDACLACQGSGESTRRGR